MGLKRGSRRPTSDPLHTQPSEVAGGELQIGLDRIEPSRVVVGRGALLYLEGWCSAPRREVTRLDVVIGERVHPVRAFPLARPDLADALGERGSRGSGFCAIIPIDRTVRPGAHEIHVRATLEGGGVQVRPCGSISVEQEPYSVASESTGPLPCGTDPLIAICMATYMPGRELIERQVETIRAQTHARFICLIRDDGSDLYTWGWIKNAVGADPRFVCTRNAHRLGFYRNFEQCLSQVPEDAAYVALADQDDIWHPDKLVALLESIRGRNAQLAYSDMRIVSRAGVLVAPTAWANRPNNFTHLGSLMMMNTVTGAASLFRRELLDDILPFPPEVGRAYHDHWIACVALALGELAYVDRPLQDYVQHESNAVGHHSEILKSGMLHMLIRFIADPSLRLRNTLTHSRGVYLAEVIRLEIVGRTLELRLAGRMARDRADDVRRIAHLSSSFRAFIWLLGRSARDTHGTSSTLGAENQVSKGILWWHYQAVCAYGRHLSSALVRVSRRPCR